MKNILLLLASFLFSCSNAQGTYNLSNAIEISVPIELELRGDSSLYNQAMDGLRDEYNPNHVVKIGKSELIFQPKGTDNQETSATEDVTRILVKHFKIDSNSFPKWNFKISNQELNEINEQLKKETIREAKTLPFECEITNWTPLKTGAINGLSYVKGSYLSIVEGDKSYTETYQFFNTNEKVIISNSTSISNKDKWVVIFDEVIKTFKFKQKI